jgi:transposase-like protein
VGVLNELAGFPGAINAVSFGTEVQLCMVRNSVKYVSHKDRKAAAGVKEICLAPSAGVAKAAPVCRNLGRKMPGPFPILAEPPERGYPLHEIFPGVRAAIL